MHVFFVKSVTKDELVASLQIIPTNKKGIVIMKNQPIKLASDTFSDYVFYEEISPNTLRQLSLLLEELYLPMLKNQKNQKNWPKVVGQDIIRNIHRFRGNLSMVIGQTHGNTILPVPPVEELTDRTDDDRGLVHSLESAVIDWTREIKVRCLFNILYERVTNCI
jgi:dynein heavy chain